MKKLSTHIKGLDTLFHGGIQVTSVTDSLKDIINKSREKNSTDNKSGTTSATADKRDRDGLVIIVKGSRGVNKHLFAMQLMHGLGMSIYDEFKRKCAKDGTDNSVITKYLRPILNKFEDTKDANDTNETKDTKNAALRYYSINKPTHLLNDMYLDLLIERWIAHINVEYKDLVLKNTGKNKISEWDIDSRRKFCKYSNRNWLIFNFLFQSYSGNHECAIINDTSSTDTCTCNSHSKDKTPNSCKRVITRLFAENVIGYNARTNSVHIRTNDSNDNEANCLAKRKNDSVSEYLDVDGASEIKNLSDETSYYVLKREFLNATFNKHLWNEKEATDGSSGYATVRNALSARMNFFSILHDIENDLEEEEEKKKKQAKDKEKEEKEKNQEKKSSEGCNNEGTDKSNDADSGINDPYPYLCEAMVIDGFSHISEKDLQSLPFTHLVDTLRKFSRISILVFEDTQTAMPDGDIEIEIRSNFDQDEDYSFTELRIAKCVNQVASLGWHLYKRQESHVRIYPSIHLNLFKRSYINNQMHEISLPIIKDSYAMHLASNGYPDVKYMSDLDGMLKKIDDNSSKLFDSIFNSAQGAHVEERGNDNNDNRNKILAKILMGSWQTESKDNLRLHSHRPITTIVGNLNSFKRNLAMYRAFSSKQENKHVLVLLLDKDPEEMRKKLFCPGLCSDSGNRDKDKCRKCHERISLLNINSGCITPEEFLSMLKDHISVYTGYRKDDVEAGNDKDRRPLHIVFDDYHRIDFSFPFLSSSNLFTTALISLCQRMDVGLTILCDKDSKRVREVCTLSDYVVCVKREEDDVPRRITLYTERNGDECHPSSIIKYEISDAMRIMKCDGSSLAEVNGKLISSRRIGSMKEYWRQSYNMKSKKDK